MFWPLEQTGWWSSFQTSVKWSRVQWWTLWLFHSAHPEKTGKQRQAWGKQLLGDAVFSARSRAEELWHCTLLRVCSASVQLLLWPETDSTFLGGEWSSGGVFTQKGFELLGASQKKGHNPWVSVSLVLPTTVHLQGGWDLLQPLPAKAAPSSCHNSWCFWVSSTDSPGPVPRQGSAATDAFLIRP